MLEIEEVKYNLTIKIDLDDVASYLGKIFTNLTQCEGYVINRWSNSDQALTIAKLCLPEPFNSVEDTYRNYRIYAGENDPNFTVFESREHQFISDASQISNGSTRSRFERWKMKELLILPISDHTHCSGTAMLFSCSTSLNLSCLDYLLELTALFTPPLKSSSSLRDIRSHNLHLNSLMSTNDQFNDYLSNLSSYASHQSNCHAIIDYLISLFDFDLGAMIIRVDNHLEFLPATIRSDAYLSQQLEFNDLFKDHKFKLDISEAALVACYLQKSPLCFANLDEIRGLPMSALDRLVLDTFPDMTSVVYIPISTTNDNTGVLCLTRFGRTDPIPDHHTQMLFTLCEIASIDLLPSNISETEIICGTD